MKSALLAVNTMTYFVGLVEIGRLLQGQSDYKPVFYFTQQYPKCEQDMAICTAEGMEYVCAFKETPATNSDSSRLTQRQNTIKKICLSLYGSFPVGFFYEMMSYAREFIKIDKLIRRLRPAILIIAGDNTGHNTNILVKVCHKYNIPSAIIPMFTTGPVEAAEAYYYNPIYDCKRVINRIFAYFDPKWVYVHRGKKLLRWPAFKILAMKLFGLVPPLPWVLNSSHADLILVESDAVEKFMLREGIQSEQIKLTGSPANDIMAEHMGNFGRRRDELCHELKLDSSKPIVLCALPPNILYGYSRPECDFKRYEDLVEFWVKSLTEGKNHNILISLHPAIKYEEINYIEEYGVKIARKKSIDLIPFCDLFVAAMSGTIYWATACGKPVLNYDVYKYGYTDFYKYEGIVYTKEKLGFKDLLKKFTTDKKFYNEVLEIQKRDASQWGILDGCGGNRILKNIEELIKKYE